MQNAVERSSKKKTENLLTGVSTVEGKVLTQRGGSRETGGKELNCLSVSETTERNRCGEGSRGGSR